MSAEKSIMPGGTRLAALIALALVACLCAWRANAFLNANAKDASGQTAEQRQLAAFIEPVLGRQGIRVAHHTLSDGTSSFLILVDAPEERFHIDTELAGRISSILEAAAGYDAAQDRLQIQPFSFAPGTAGGFSGSELFELGALAGLGVLVGFIAFASRGSTPAARSTAHPQPHANQLDERPVLRAVPVEGPAPLNDTAGEARRAASVNPQATAQVLRSWMRQDGGSRS